MGGVDEPDLGLKLRSAGGQALVRAWAPDEPHGPQPRPPAPVRRGSRAFASGRGLGDDSWREGSADLLISRFARVRVRAAHRSWIEAFPVTRNGSSFEWPTEEEKPTKFWLATLPQNVAFDRFRRAREAALAQKKKKKKKKKKKSPPTSWSPNGRGFPPQEPTRLLAATSVPAGSTRRSPADPTGAPPDRTRWSVYDTKKPHRERVGALRRCELSVLHRRLERTPAEISDQIVVAEQFPWSDCPPLHIATV